MNVLSNNAVRHWKEAQRAVNCECNKLRARWKNRERESPIHMCCAAGERFLASAGWTDSLKLREGEKKGKRDKARQKRTERSL